MHVVGVQTGKPVSAQRLGRLHSPEYAGRVEQFCDTYVGRFEEDTVVSHRSYEVALHAAGAVCDAVERVVESDDPHAFCLVRPPGHHALCDAAMGFCLFNNIAIAAKVAIDELGLDRVLIIDWDVHHGNGTQEMFWEDEQVGFFSIHRWPFFPGTGQASETGSGRGLGATRQLTGRIRNVSSRIHRIVREPFEPLRRQDETATRHDLRRFRCTSRRSGWFSRFGNRGLPES